MDTSFEEIEAARTAAKISRSELCRAADIHDTTYHKLLKGHVKSPQRRTIAKLKKALKQLKGEME